MKKLLTVCAACMVAGMVSAQVESQNIVGYQTYTTGINTLEMLGANFVQVGGTDATLSALLSGTFSVNDEILVWNGAGYDTYTYKANIFDGAGLVTTWTQDGFTKADPTMATGLGFWIRTVSATDVTTQGEVPDAASNAVTLVPGNLNLVSSTFPADVQLADLTFNSIAINDEVLFWNGSGYDTYTYKANIFDGAGLVTTWTQDGFTQANPTIVAGTGFWARGASSTQVTFPSPL